MAKPSNRRLVSVFGLGLLGLLSFAGCSEEGEADERDRGEHASQPTCIETRQAEGTGYLRDAAVAIAISRGIEPSHPEISGIVDAVAAYQQGHPDDQNMDPAESLPSDADGPVVYQLVLFDLISRPDIATPDVIAALERAATESGMNGIHSLMMNAGRYPAAENGGQPMTDLRELVGDQTNAIAEAGITQLPSPDCGVE